MLRDLAIVMMAAGVGIVLTLGGVLAREGLRRRPWADVLDMVEAPPLPRTGSGVSLPMPQVVKPLRCICTARLSFCQCEVDGVRNPRGAGRGRGQTRLSACICHEHKPHCDCVPMQDALARQRGENLDGSPRRETRVRLEGRWP